MDYCARANIGVPGYGRVTPGEILDEKCKEVLGEEALNDLVQRGALRLMTDAKPEPERGQEDAEPPEEPDGENAEAPEEPGEEAEDEEAEALEPDTMDDVVDEDSEAAPEPKPRKKGGRRKTE